MTSFAKHIAVFVAALIATTALGAKSDDDKSSTPNPKEAGTKKLKKNKDSKNPDDPDGAKGKMDIPVPQGHDAKGLTIPYFGNDGKRQMNFTIGVASRIDANHLRMTDMQVETFNDDGEHEMQIDLPTSILDTDTSVITTHKHVTIRRADFDLTGESMIFNTKTKQGGLGGNVHMLIYNLDDQTSNSAKPDEPKNAVRNPDPKARPDEFKTPASRQAAPEATPDKFNTPASLEK